MSAPLDLKNYFCAQRWFGGKGKKIADIRCLASLAVVKNCDWQIYEVIYEDGATEWYQVPLIQNEDALASPEVREQVFELLKMSQTIPAVFMLRAENFRPPPSVSESRLLTIEQSNSSISYGSTSFLKIFRKLEDGLNPDIEILSHLTKLQSDIRVPKIYSTLQMEHRGKTYALAVLLEMVANRGNAWEIALEAARHGQDFLKEAELLGKRTAEMHLALATESSNPAFGMISSSPVDWNEISNNLRRDTAELLQLLTAKIPALKGESSTLAAQFVAEARSNLEKLIHPPAAFPLSRIHGDYHLGQILTTEEDFIIIDFEGEPARPLSERRKHFSPLIDVAGMLRSFHYAGCTAGAFTWQKNAADTFLNAYFSICRGSRILPDEITTRQLLEVFSWQKKLYEIRYELNNRPDWLWIPLK